MIVKLTYPVFDLLSCLSTMLLHGRLVVNSSLLKAELAEIDKTVFHGSLLKLMKNVDE